MEIAASNIVRSVAGRDQGKLFIVLAVEDENRLSEKIRGEARITNSELRKTLAAYREEVYPDQEG